MKKLFLALLVTLLCFGVALADSMATTVTVANATPVNGVYSGSYYYKVYVSGGEMQMAFSQAVNADAPTAEDVITTEHPDDPDAWWQRDAGGAFMITTAPRTGDPTDALFYRAGTSGAWQKIVFQYDLTKGDNDGDTDFITNTAFPTELMQDYTVTWQPQQNADLYFLRWLVPNGRGYAFWFSGNESSYTLSTDRERWNNWGGPENLTGFVGDYEFWVTALVDGEYRNSVHKTFTIAAPEAGVVRVQSDKQDEHGAVTMRLNEWIDLQIHANPNHLEELAVVCGDRIEYPGWDEDGNVSFTWTADIDDYEEYTYNAYARARYEGQDEWVYSNVIPITVEMKDQIEGDLTWTVNGSTTVARDGMFIIDVNNIGADFYNMYVRDAFGEWIADSHWVWAEEGDTTTVRMPLVNLTPGEYDVHVFAVQYGAPNLDAEDTIHITVTDPVSDNPLLISMRDSYVTGDFLRIAARYTNPLNLPYTGLNIRIVDTDNDGIYYREETQDNFFWDEGTKFWRSGNYKLIVEAWGRNSEEAPFTRLATAEFPFQVTADRDITVTLPTLPDTLNAGQGLSFTVQKPAGADEYTVEVWIDQLDNDYGRDPFLQWGITDDTCTVSVSADDLADALSTVYVAVEGIGYNAEGDFKYKIIPYYHATDSRAQITVSGLDENGSMPVSQNVRVRVAATGESEIQTVRLFDGNGLWDEEGMDRDGTWTRDIIFDHEGDYTVFAMVTFDPWQEEWDGLDYDPRTWVYTNTVVIHATKEGEVSPFGFDLSKNEAERGEFITVTYDPAEHVDQYWVDIERYNPDDGNWEWVDGGCAYLSVDLGEGGSTLLPTAQLQPGRYHVRAAGRSAGYEGYWGDWTEELIITEPTGQQGQNPVHLFIQPTGIQTGDRVSISAYADGAHWIDVYWDYQNNDGWNDNWGGDSFADERSPYWSSGSYQVVAVAWYPLDEADEYGNDHYPVYSDPITVTVSAPGDQVSLPEADLPASLTEGQDLRVTVPALAGAEWMDLNLDIEDQYGSRWHDDRLYWDGDDSGLDVTIPWSLLEEKEIHAGQILILHANAGVPGKNVKNWERRIPIVEAQSDEAVLTVSGLDANGAIPVSQDFTIRVAATGSRPIQALSVFNGNSFWGQDGPDPNGAYERNHSLDDAGTYSIYALVTFDEWREEYDGLDHDPRTWIYTNVVTVKAMASGQAGAFTFSMDKTSAARGESITVSYGASAHADHYWVDVERYNEDGYYWDWYDHLADLRTEAGMGGTANLFTATLEPGRYRAVAKSLGVGYTLYETNRQEFTVTESQLADRTVLLNVYPTNIPTGGQYNLSVYAPGAEWIDVYNDYPNNYDWMGGSWGGDAGQNNRRDYWGVGDYRMVAVAHYSGDPDDIAVSQAVVMRVTAPNGSISLPQPTLPDTLNVGDSLAFSITAPSAFEWCDASIGIRYEDGREEWPQDFRWDGDSNKTISVSLPWSWLEDWQVGYGCSVIVQINGGAAGYQVDNVHCRIPVLNVPQNPEATLAFEGVTGSEYTALVNVDTNLIVSPAAGETRRIQAVRFYDGYGLRGEDGYIREDGTYRTDVSHTNTDAGLKLYAMVTYDEWDGQGEDNRSWVVTNVLTLNLTSNGSVDPFGITDVSPAAVKRGEKIRVTLSQSANAQEYWLNGDGFGYDWQWVDEANRVAEFSTMYLEPGEYRINATAVAPGLEAYHTDFATITVLEPDADKVTLYVDKTDLLTQEQTNWAAFAPGAVSINVRGWSDDGGFFDGTNDGDAIEGRNNFGGHAGTAYIQATATYPNGSIRASDLVTINVTAPYGNLGDFTVCGNKYYEGGRVEFTIFPDEHADWFIVHQIWDATDGQGPVYYQSDNGPEWGSVYFCEENMTAHLGITVYQAAEGYNDIQTTMYYRPIDNSGTLNLPAFLKTIEEEAFEGNGSATHVIIPYGVTSIGARAFDNCGFCTVEIPASVTSIGEGAFVEGNVTIYGYGGSAAQRYAEAHNGVDFVQID